jgi:hypothetical protein
MKYLMVGLILFEMIIAITILQMRKQTQRGSVICPRLCSKQIQSQDLNSGLPDLSSGAYHGTRFILSHMDVTHPTSGAFLAGPLCLAQCAEDKHPTSISPACEWAAE